MAKLKKTRKRPVKAIHESDESDDPLAIGKSDHEVVPPSDEEEYDAWRAGLGGDYWSEVKLISRATPAGPSGISGLGEERHVVMLEPRRANESLLSGKGTENLEVEDEAEKLKAGSIALADLIPSTDLSMADVAMELDPPQATGNVDRSADTVAVAVEEVLHQIPLKDIGAGTAVAPDVSKHLRPEVGTTAVVDGAGSHTSPPSVRMVSLTPPPPLHPSLAGLRSENRSPQEEMNRLTRRAVTLTPPPPFRAVSLTPLPPLSTASFSGIVNNSPLGAALDQYQDLAVLHAMTLTPPPIRSVSGTSTLLLAADPSMPLSPAAPALRSPSLTPAPPSPPPPADPALQDFLSKRTIPRLRNRTAVQLHPYQMERAHYLTVIRQGRRPVEEEMSLAAEKRARNVAEDYGAEDETLRIESMEQDPSKAVEHQAEPEPEDGDRVEYYSQFGHSYEAEDSLAIKRMRRIMEERETADKEEKRRQREIRRERREFEALVKLRQGHAAVAGSENDEPVAKKKKRIKDGAAGTSKTPKAKSKTYARRDRSRHVDRAGEGAPTPARHQSSTARSGSPVLVSPGADFGDGGFDDFGDFEMTDSPLTSARQPHRVERVLPESSDDSDDEESDGGGEVVAKKRIAGRMLPAVMLKKLETDQAKREARAREKRERQARAGASASPVRPGKAIIRKSRNRAAKEALDDAMSFLVDPDETLSEGEENGLSFYLAEQAKERAKLTPIVITSDEDGDLLESTSSEAHEDNAIHRQNRLLDDGDFESIVNGGDQLRARPRPRPVQRRRPVIGLVGAPRPVRPVSAPKTPAPPRRQGLQQTRLDFDRPNGFNAAARRPKAKTRRNQPQPRSRVRPRQPRQPAIYLDDETIYAPEDFAFETSLAAVDDALSDAPSVASIRSTTPVSTRKARPFMRTTSKASSTTSVTAGDTSKKRGRGTRDAIAATLKAPEKKRLLRADSAFDANVGKIRSWQFLGACDPDFGLAPLPSGTTMAPHSMLATGHILNILRSLHGLHVDVKPPEAVSAFGFHLESTTTSEAMVEVVDPIFALLHTRVLELANDRLPLTAEHLNPVLKVLCFFRDRLLAGSVGDETGVLRTTLHSASDNITREMASVPTGRARGDRTLPDFLLQARWVLVEMLALTSQAASEMVVQALKDMAGALLDYGVNATMKSIKFATSLNPGAPQLDDVSVDIWVALRCLCQALDRPSDHSHLLPAVGQGSSFATVVDHAVAQTVAANPTGPEAAERVWYLTLGLCALSQLSPDGRVDSSATAPMWHLVKRAINLVTIVNDEQTESSAMPAQVKNRDAYVRVMLIRALSLVSTWGWEFADRESVATATRSLGLIFKSRNHRDLPSEHVADFPRYIVAFDMSLTAQLSMDEGTAYDLYLRLICISASDLLSSASTMEAALQAEKDVQRLLQPIFPISPFPYTKEHPPSPRQLSALTNRYSTLVIACYFSPPLLPWLLGNALKWLDFTEADFNSRRQSIRGVMYLAVACRHHGVPIDSVVARLKDMLDCLLVELQDNRAQVDPMIKARARKCIERTIALVVSAFRQIIVKHSFDSQRQAEPRYPPSVLLEAWAGRVMVPELMLDRVYGREIISAVQSFLDRRNATLPVEVNEARAAKGSISTDDEYPSLGFEFSEGDLAALGDVGVAVKSEHYEDDLQLARVIDTVISPTIYQTLSSLLTVTGDHSVTRKPDLLAYLHQLTKCWVDCANIVVVDHRLQDWTTFIGYGKQSWNRLGDEIGKRQVGMDFMLDIARIDPGVFQEYEDTFVNLLLQSLIAEESRVNLEPDFLNSVLSMPRAVEHPFLLGLTPGHDSDSQNQWSLDAVSFIESRPNLLQTIFSNIPNVMQASAPPKYKGPAYQSINILVTSILQTYQSIASTDITARDRYRNFSNATVADLQRLTGHSIQASMITNLKHFPLH